jgi:Fe-S oxidoreductase
MSTRHFNTPRHQHHSQSTGITLNPISNTFDMEFHYFVLPFAIGFYGLMAILLIKVVEWTRKFDKNDRRNIANNIMSLKSIRAIREIVSESLLHRKIFAINPLLGWMHMTFAFGWFLLIVFGKVQTTVHTGDWTNPVWDAIFFRYFETKLPSTAHSTLLPFLMDAILLFILSGVGLAMFKRYKAKAMGLTSTTNHQLIDKLALAVIWSIFPLRLLAESITSGLYGGGSFLTGTVGHALSSLPFLNHLFMPAWWAYSLVLGTFFAILPLTRYMHIPAEMVLIFFRHWGVKDNHMVELQLEACSRCGICIDGCATLPLRQQTQAVYLLRQARAKHPIGLMAHTCMECGSCQTRCPVGIDLPMVRQHLKQKEAPKLSATLTIPTATEARPQKVLYYAGCIGKLTPSVTRAMATIAAHAKLEMHVIGDDEMMCCGRPMLLSGNGDAAQKMVLQNTQYIDHQQADLLITSCPVCYKMFNENYSLKTKTIHHTQFIDGLLSSKAIVLQRKSEKITYHDPCELGRGSNVYEAPRRIIDAVGKLVEAPMHAKMSMCCGGSAAGYNIGDDNRNVIATLAVNNLQYNNPDQIATSCPMCKKSLARHANVPVKDIAQIVAASLHNEKTTMHRPKAKTNNLKKLVPDFQL